jgi:hypothetical protein
VFETRQAEGLGVGLMQSRPNVSAHPGLLTEESASGARHILSRETNAEQGTAETGNASFARTAQACLKPGKRRGLRSSVSV